MTVNLLSSNQSDYFTLSIMANSPDLKSKLTYLGHYNYTVGSLNGIYGIKLFFPAPTGILFIFTKGCFLSEVVSRKNNHAGKT